MRSFREELQRATWARGDGTVLVSRVSQPGRLVELVSWGAGGEANYKPITFTMREAKRGPLEA